MSRSLFMVSLITAAACFSPAFAQNSSPACQHTKAVARQNSNAPNTSMSDTSSDMGNRGSGASSASIGTGPTDKTGVYSPCLPGIAGQGVTGAVPRSTNKTNNP